jgi:hypothetical protein
MQAQTNQLLGPASGAGIVREISPNGRYIVGQDAYSVRAGYVWDTQNGNTLVSFPGPSEAFSVTDNRLIVGSFSDGNFIKDGTAIRSGGYIEPEATDWTSLGLGFIEPSTANSSDGTSVWRVTSDGKTIVGRSGKYQENNRIDVAYAWIRNDDGEWIGEEWGHPENASQSVIIDVADDGQTAVGFIHNGLERQGILWKSKNDYELPLGVNPVSETSYSEYLCISPNGEYAGFNYGGQTEGQACIHHLKTGEITLIPNGVLINDISNDGLAVGVYRPAGIDKAFVWSKKLGFMDFGEFISQYAPDITLSSSLKNTFSISGDDRYSVNALTPDGLNFAIQVTTSGIPRQANAYVLKLASPIEVYPFPRDLTATVSLPDRNKVVLMWEAPVLEGETLTGYAIYRNASATPVATVEANVLNYTDENVPNGYHNYKVKALYGAGFSNASNTAQAIIVDTYALPFRENFNSLNLTKNYWTTVIEKGISPIIPLLGWDAYPDAGVEAGTGAMFHANNFYGFADKEFSSSLISKYLDGRNASKIYLSFLVRPDYYLESELTPDTLFIDVFDGENWVNIDKSVFKLSMEWKAEILDLSPVAAGRFFRVRFRIMGENRTVSAKYIYFDDITVSTTLPAGNAVPKNILSEEKDNSLQLVWQHPLSSLYALTYANSPKRFSVGNAGQSLIAVNRFDAEDLSIYEGRYLTSITAYIHKKVNSPAIGTALKLAVYENDVRTVEQTVSTFVPNAWNTFVLDEPVLLQGQNLKFGLEVTAHDAKEEPIGVDGTRNPVTGKGDLFSEDGGITWQTLTAASRVNNWCIIGNVADDVNVKERDTKIVGYNVYHNGVRLNEDLIFKQSFVTEGTKRPLTLRAYSIESGLSAEAVWDDSSGSIQIPSKIGLNLYPNPVRDILSIDSDRPLESIWVYDMTGRLFRHFDCPVKFLQTTDWEKGVYLMKIVTFENEIIKRKVIKD